MGPVVLEPDFIPISLNAQVGYPRSYYAFINFFFLLIILEQALSTRLTPSRGSSVCQFTIRTVLPTFYQHRSFQLQNYWKCPILSLSLLRLS